MKRPTHPELVEALVKPAKEIASQLTDDPLKAHLAHMALGVAGEAGEIVDCIKKFSIYGKELDMKNLLEELGDMEWYLEGIRAPLEIERGLTLELNIDKLLKRYEGIWLFVCEWIAIETVRIVQGVIWFVHVVVCFRFGVY